MWGTKFYTHKSQEHNQTRWNNPRTSRQSHMRQAASDADAFGSGNVWWISNALRIAAFSGMILLLGWDLEILAWRVLGRSAPRHLLSFLQPQVVTCFQRPSHCCLLPGHRLPCLRHPRRQRRGWRIDENLQSHAGSDSRGHMSNFPVPALISPPVMSPVAQESVSVSETSISVYLEMDKFRII